MAVVGPPWDERHRAAKGMAQGPHTKGGWLHPMLSGASLLVMPGLQLPSLSTAQIVLVAILIIIGVLLGPYQLLSVIGRMWEQRRRDRIARGEDVRPKKLPWDEDD